MKLTPTLGGSLSGSLGGLTASHNKGGQYLRRRSVPTNPNTARQQAVRAKLTALTQAWNNVLTETQRQAWRDYAASTPRTDKLGQTITLTGQQWYIASNTPRLQQLTSGLSVAGDGRVDAAPTINNTGEPTTAITVFTINTTTPLLTVTGLFSAPASADGFALLYLGLPVNDGRRFFKGPYQFAAAVAYSADDTSWSIAVDPSSSTAWVAAYQPGAADDGRYFGLRVIAVYDDGRTSTQFRQLTQFSDVTP